MNNPFLSSKNYDTRTAGLLERAVVMDIGKAVAFTDGDKIFMNTSDNLFHILPAYDDNMLKWLLWHEKLHMELRHHNRFFKYLREELNEADKFQVTKDEVNIIMDILVHDKESEMFPELVETALNNLAQFRDRNSLKYTFKTHTLEEMLKEYQEFKQSQKQDKEQEPNDTQQQNDSDDQQDDTQPQDDHQSEQEDNSGSESKESPSPEEEDNETDPSPEEENGQPNKDTGHHDETDWSGLDKIDNKEFISESEANRLLDKVQELRRIKIRLAQITKTLNGLVTTTQIRTYKTPSHIMTGQRTILKGRQYGKASLYLVFDASGSMMHDMNTFKDIISQAIPQAMKTPTAWFAGTVCTQKGRDILKKCQDKNGRDDYYKGTFQDFMEIEACVGYDDDGDRTIELCYKAEQQGYSPIGVTDGRLEFGLVKRYVETTKENSICM